MRKAEVIWRDLLSYAIEKKQVNFKQSELAKRFSMSLSIVNAAIYPLKDLGIVSIQKRNSSVIDVERLLYFWSTRRILTKDLIYETYSPLSVFERENSMPEGVFPTAYSACRLYYHELPADYDQVYFYASNIDEIKKRFPPMNKKAPNVHILKVDNYFAKYKRTTLGQIFADLWNLGDWYAKDYCNAVLLEIKQRIGL